MSEIEKTNNVTLWLEEDLWIRFKQKVAANKETMQSVLYEAVIQYLMDNTEITHKGMKK